MADIETELPEGTDTVIAGASKTDADDATGQRSATETDRPVVGAGSASGGISDRLRTGRDRRTSPAGDRARGLVGQGLERYSEALAHVGRQTLRNVGTAVERVWRLCPPRCRRDRERGQQHRQQGPRRADRRCSHIRPQQPGCRACRRRSRRVRPRAPRKDRPRDDTQGH